MIHYKLDQKVSIKNDISKYRVFSLLIFFVLFFFVVIFRLFTLQIIQHKTYLALASGQYEIFQQLFPVRGKIYIHDDDNYSVSANNKNLYPLATNKVVYDIYINPIIIEDKELVKKSLIEILNISDESEIELIKQKINKQNDPFEPIKNSVQKDIIEKLKKLNLKGVGISEKKARYYPEKELASNVLGFTRLNDNQELIGQYGIEGFYNTLLSGERGHLKSEKDAIGRFIAIGKKDFEPAKDGADIILTIDKSIQFMSCSKIKEAVKRFDAQSVSFVAMNPQTGAILAMCNYPTFDPNEFNKVEDIKFYNNTVIYDAYEPGSIFKPITMAGAIDTEKITPTTTYTDTGSISYNNAGEVETNPVKIVHTLRNFAKRIHGTKTMTEILQNSINTGTVNAMQKMGTDAFEKYVKDFGFGEKTGITLATELSGNISSLSKQGEIYSATASFGQGITTTPLQMVNSYAVFANGGKLMKPYIVDEIHYTDGKIEKTEPVVVKRPISERTASLITGMLISVVEAGHAKKAGVKGYYIAGKTGTAQVAENGVYGDATIQSFVGYGPTDNPRFVMIVRIDNPKIGGTSAETATIVFGEIAKYIIDYYRIKPER